MKQDLTEYLAKHTRTAMQREGIGFSITYAKITETNIPTMLLELMNHDHEEVDMLLILHALDIAKGNPFKECIVLSPDTDVFLILIYYYQSLPHLKYFRTGAGESQPNIDIQICYEAIDVRHAQAILGFHVLTELSWWKVFLKADNILNTLSRSGTGEKSSRSCYTFYTGALCCEYLWYVLYVVHGQFYWIYIFFIPMKLRENIGLMKF